MRLSSLCNHASSSSALLAWILLSLTMMMILECTTAFAITDTNYDTKNVNDQNSYDNNDIRQLQPGNDNTEAPDSNSTIVPTDVTYEKCYVCGAEDLYVSLPDLNITIVNETASCSQVERAGREGLIPSGVGCRFATNAVVADCECAPITNGITDVPTFGDSELDTAETATGTTTDSTPESSPVPSPALVPTVIGGPTVILEPTDSSDVPTPLLVPTLDTTFAPTVTVPPSDMVSDFVTISPTTELTLPRGNEPTSNPATADIPTAPSAPTTPSAPTIPSAPTSTIPSAPTNTSSSALKTYTITSSLSLYTMVLLSLVASSIISFL